MAGPALALLYVIAATTWIAAYSVWLAPLLSRSLSPRVSKWIIFVTITLLALAIALINPLIDTAGFTVLGYQVGASDNDDAVRLGIAALLDGQNPYLQRTFLDQVIGPLPGSFVLGAPFYLLGSVAYASIFFLWLFWFLASRQSPTNGTLLFLLILTASPAVIYQALAGMDYTTDIMAVIGLGALAIHLRDKLLWLHLIAVGVGIAMATRINLVLLAIPLMAVVFEYHGWRRALSTGIAMAAGFLAISIPFYLWDPDSFSPVQAGSDKVDGFSLGPLVFPLVGLAVGVILALLLPHRNALDFYRDAFWIQFAVLSLATLMRFLIDDPQARNYFNYGVLALYPGALFFWARITSRQQRKHVHQTDPRTVADQAS